MEQLETVDANSELDLTTASVDADVPAVPEAFHVHDADSANWVVKRIVEARAYAQRVKEWAVRETRRAEREEQFFMMRYGPQLEDWSSQAIAKLKGRRRSVSLPGGSVGYRRCGAMLVIDDASLVLQWAKEACPDAVVVKETIKKASISEHFHLNGELPEGAHLEAEKDEFYIR